MDLVTRTWEELGFKVRATGWKVWVRTLPHPRKIGRIWLPPKAASFYGELPHLRTVYALVLTSGPLGWAKDLKPGDKVAFKRLNFSWIKKLEPTQVDEYGGDEEYVGTINAGDVVYVVEEADGVRIPKNDEGATVASV